LRLEVRSRCLVGLALREREEAAPSPDGDFDPEAVRQLKARAVRDITVGGPDLAAQAIRAGLVDEYHLFVTPILVGSGKQSLPNGVRLELELLGERLFGNGVVHLRYRTRT